MAQIIELILTHDRVGKGTKDDPVRLNTQLFSKSGELIAEEDGYTGKMAFFPRAINPYPLPSLQIHAKGLKDERIFIKYLECTKREYRIIFKWSRYCDCSWCVNWNSYRSYFNLEDYEKLV